MAQVEVQIAVGVAPFQVQISLGFAPFRVVIALAICTIPSQNCTCHLHFEILIITRIFSLVQFALQKVQVTRAICTWNGATPSAICTWNGANQRAN